ncbi:MAG TPA: hypothetical protein VM933_11150 [Acidimicrobiales bacterium]|nr:hypothetical protein [Acidimicrobiales bacterium]
MTPQKLALFVGALRLGIGSALVVAPKFAGGVWIGENAGGKGIDVFARAIGARDVVLGARTLAAVRGEAPARHWLKLGFAADAADAVATVLAFRSLTGIRRIVMPLIAGAVAAVGYTAANQLD